MAKKKAVPLRYFYLNDMLHKKLHINRTEDSITTWCYPLKKRVAYTYSEVKKNKRPAFSLVEAGQMLNRKRLVLEHAILNGQVERPQYTYRFDKPDTIFKYLLSEKDVLNMYGYLKTVHRGRPRADGRVTPQAMPNERELRAMMRQEEILYVRNDEGEFVPVWRANDFT